jgi:hypothetical protein
LILFNLIHYFSKISILNYFFNIYFPVYLEAHIQPRIIITHHHVNHKNSSGHFDLQRLQLPLILSLSLFGLLRVHSADKHRRNQPVQCGVAEGFQSQCDEVQW